MCCRNEPNITGDDTPGGRRLRFATIYHLVSHRICGSSHERYEHSINVERCYHGCDIHLKTYGESKKGQWTKVIEMSNKRVDRRPGKHTTGTAELPSTLSEHQMPNRHQCFSPFLPTFGRIYWKARLVRRHEEKYVIVERKRFGEFKPRSSTRFAVILKWVRPPEKETGRYLHSVERTTTPCNCKI